jgi:sulfur carrier protein ThiS
MIRVKVFPPAFCSFEKLDNNGWMKVPEGSTLSYVLKEIKMPKIVGKLFAASVNGERARLSTILKEGDVIGFFALISGG